MRCEEYRELLTLRMDDALSADQTRDHDEHAAACAACRALRDDRRNERDRWRTAWAEEAPADLRRKILAAEAPAGRKVVPLRRWLPWAAAAALMLMIAPPWRPDEPPRPEPFSEPCNLVHEEALGDDRILVLPGRLL